MIQHIFVVVYFLINWRKPVSHGKIVLHIVNSLRYTVVNLDPITTLSKISLQLMKEHNYNILDVLCLVQEIKNLYNL